jgi:hypothetical protein
VRAHPLIDTKNELVVDRKSKALAIEVRKVHFEGKIDKYLVITLYFQSEAEEGWLIRNPFLKRFTWRDFRDFIDAATISSIILERTASRK